MNLFEKILESAEEDCNWTNETKIDILLDYLNENCLDKVEHFQTTIMNRISEEINLTEE